ncbi:MAG: membrane protein insertion efficiency factor YidD [Bacteroidales bacterium]|nr:membrane protein insertion efficiency factor YidD [Bacteroidales bacterium]
MNRYRDLMQPSNTVQHFSTKIDPTNEFKLILTTAFSLYKHFVSSQDAVHCVFYPSCSVYALETIQTNGFIGIFDAIDRLTRCNGFSPEKYHMHEASHHFYDPVKKLH